MAKMENFAKMAKKKKGKNEHYTKTCNGWLGKF